MIKIIAEGAFDTAHSIFEAKKIWEERPDAVFMEVPDEPFQKIFDDYSSGKLGMSQLKKKMLKAIKAEKKKVEHTLLQKFLEGEIEEEELEALETEGREIHVMQIAKKVGAKLYAMDLPLDEVENALSVEFKKEHIKNTRKLLEARQIPYILWELSDIFHYPFYLVERLMRHHAVHTSNPFKHDPSTCPVCSLGVHWDRFFSSVIIPLLEKILPLSSGMKQDLKVAYIIRKIDQHREYHMAETILKKYRELQKKLKREPNIVVIVHLWSAVELRRILKGLE